MADPPNVADYDNPTKSAMIGLSAIAVFMLVFGVWGTHAPMAAAAIAEGNLQVLAQRQTVQHPYGGIVKQLLVREGQHVVANEPLLELVGTEARSELDVQLTTVGALQARKARLECERDGHDVVCLQDARPEVEADGEESIAIAWSNEEAVMRARAARNIAERGMLLANTAELNERLIGIDAQLEGLDREEQSLGEEIPGIKTLYSSGFTSRTRLLNLERELSRVQSSKGTKRAERAAALKAISETELAVARFDHEWIADITQQITETNTALAAALPRLQTAQDVALRTIVRAPATGEVVGLTIFTEGGVVQAGSPILDIVPDDEPIIVEARLPLIDVNFVESGDDAEVRLTGVPVKDRPELRGKVISVSADKISSSTSGAEFFGIRVELDKDDLLAQKIRLRPGMPAEVIIVTEKRTLFSYIVGPLLDQVARAFREQ